MVTLWTTSSIHQVSMEVACYYRMDLVCSTIRLSFSLTCLGNFMETTNLSFIRLPTSPICNLGARPLRLPASPKILPPGMPFMALHILR
jgi:hypothetical protein